MQEKTWNRLLFLLALLLLPFVLAFDPVDSAGTYVKASGGHGTYHITGCHRNFDSEFSEGQISMRHSFATGSVDSNSSHSLFQKIKPSYTTFGYFGDFAIEKLTVVKDSANPTTLGNIYDTHGFSGGAYLGLDWKWVGLDLGLCSVLFNLDIQDAERKTVFPMLGLRLGLLKNFYASAELFGSSPMLTGGGTTNIGLGAKWNSTRAWGGFGGYNIKGSEPMGIVKIDQGLGPWALSFAILGNGKNVAPKGLGIDQEYGISLGISYRLSSLDDRK